ncbi:DUF6527 family protein [Paraburkholderia sp. SEWSISQ10-3 4]|uniref:DUF6527 family protein n=1 Tax=Paraburkholderia TaxID=1822464 RepID=UPI002258CD4A|nr:MULTISPECIES: DUF6527 family protein [Paraburkholderia]MCX4141123.1 DUF6527 family protein [Paraburkholderia aspalathi]MDN7173806.1 DUF6527 family protein [Paraburkholderia sp. SEWSISQ10-3 4]MDQ6503447.1 DUF6527 family protein [Paraburkholderia aspalathi]
MIKLSELRRRALAFFIRRRRVRITEGDSLPRKLPLFDLVLAREDDEDWCVGFRCPCGCNERVELLLIKEAKPRWDIAVTRDMRPTLIPSVWLNKGCRSHFYVRDGRIVWCR